MKIIVETQEQANMVHAVCKAALASGDLGIAKVAVIITEALQIAPTEDEKKPAVK